MHRVCNHVYFFFHFVSKDILPTSCQTKTGTPTMLGCIAQIANLSKYDNKNNIAKLIIQKLMIIKTLVTFCVLFIYCLCKNSKTGDGKIPLKVYQCLGHSNKKLPHPDYQKHTIPDQCTNAKFVKTVWDSKLQVNLELWQCMGHSKQDKLQIYRYAKNEN